MIKGMFAVAAAFSAVPANATLYQVTLNGIVTRQTSMGMPTVIDVGDRVTLTARFDDRRVVDWGTTGVIVAGMPKDMPIAGDQFYRIDVNGFVIASTAEELDGDHPFYEDDLTGQQLAIPSIGGKDGKVVGVAGYMIPSGDAPSLFLGAFGGSGYRHCNDDKSVCDPPVFSDLRYDGPEFRVVEFAGYDNSYLGPSFVGVWDLENSSFVAVPEPATWALMLAGFGLAGTAARRRKLVSSAAG